MTNNQKNKIAAISHDAGGAEILSSYIAHSGLDCLYVLDGPARNIFERKLGSIEIISLEEAVDNATSIICSTSWQSDIECNAIKLARQYGKHSIAFLDHWVNYRERFIRLGEISLPDEIWVGDVYAEKLAYENFPNLPIRLFSNPYIVDVKKQFSELELGKIIKNNDMKNFLFVCENISDHARLKYGDERYWGYTEFDAINFFFENIKTLTDYKVSVIIRPHPSDPRDKYNSVIQAHNNIARLSRGQPLIQEIAESDIVVGCESAAMVVALAVDKKVMSCIPPNGRNCVLPHHEIIKLQDILRNSTSIF